MRTTHRMMLGLLLGLVITQAPALRAQFADADVRIGGGFGLGGTAGVSLESMGRDPNGYSGVFVAVGNTRAENFEGEINKTSFAGGMRWYSGSLRTYTQLAWNYIGVWDPVSAPPILLEGPQLLAGYRFGETAETPLGLRLAAGFGCSLKKAARDAPGGGCGFSGELSLTFGVR